MNDYSKEDFTEEEIQAAKDCIESTQNHFLLKFRDELNDIVEEDLPEYEGCCKHRRVYSESSYDEAEKKANALMKEAFKQLNY